MRGFKYSDALRVAYNDINIGICFAVEELEKLGFDCKAYYDYIDKEMAKSDEEDFDEINLEARNYLYGCLGIDKIMERAYKNII